MNVCDYCHEEALVLYPSNGFEACAACVDYAWYYDHLTPDGQRGEEERTALLVLESLHRNHHNCDCEHRHRPIDVPDTCGCPVCVSAKTPCMEGVDYEDH